MCGIYGVLSYKDKLKDMNELVDLLGMESAERGTDATGVAYSILGNMKINKSAVSAYKFNPNIPKFVNTVIGHTRHSTQGDKSKNYNNHPWSEMVKNCQFALAHNGVLFNDKELQKKYNFKSKIETDSFVAVQLIKYNFRTNISFPLSHLSFLLCCLFSVYSYDLNFPPLLFLMLLLSSPLSHLLPLSGNSQLFHPNCIRM